MAFYIAHGNMKWRKTKGESDMGWILGITAAVGIFLAGIAGLACVAVYRVREIGRAHV